MAAAAFKRTLARLESRAETIRTARRQSASESGLTPEQRRQRIGEIIDNARARKAEIDAALAGPDPKRRAWARKQLAAANTPERRARCEELMAKIEALKANCRPMQAASSEHK